MIAVMLFVITVAVGFAAYQMADSAQDQAASTEQEVTNETLVQRYGVWQLVDKATGEYTAGFNNTVTVYNNSSAELVAGTDYEWNATDGTITFYDTASTNDGEQATITYQYEENTDAVKDLSGPLGPVVFGLGQLPKMAAGLGFFVMLIALAAVILRSNNNLKTRR